MIGELVRSLTDAASRRRVMRLIASSAMSALLGRGALPTAARNKKTKKKFRIKLCHDGQTITVGKKGKRRHRAHGDTRGACPPPAPPVSVYQCPPRGTDDESAPGNVRFAQTFTPSQNGALRQIRFDIVKQPPPATAGDYIVQLLRVSGGVRGNTAGDILAAVTIPDAEVPEGNTTLVADFPAGPALSTTTEFAAAITRPGSNDITVRTREDGGGSCAGQAFSSDGVAAFEPFSPPGDLAVTVLVV